MREGFRSLTKPLPRDGRHYWAWAPRRHRGRRVQKKIDARGGALHHLPPRMRRSAWWTAPTEVYSFHILSRSHAVVAAPSRGAAALWFELPGVRIVAKSWLGDVEVSTVFLGLDHGFGMEPRWFETMIFGGPMAELCRRYRTWELAVEGHWDTLEELRMEGLSTRVNPADDAYTH